MVNTRYMKYMINMYLHKLFATFCELGNIRVIMNSLQVSLVCDCISQCTMYVVLYYVDWWHECTAQLLYNQVSKWTNTHRVMWLAGCPDIYHARNIHSIIEPSRCRLRHLGNVTYKLRIITTFSLVVMLTRKNQSWDMYPNTTRPYHIII